MNCDETFNAGICYVTDAYKRVCKFNEELHADLEKYRAKNVRLQELLRTLAYCADDRADCDQCAMNGKPHASVPQAFCDEMAELLRQHGVEVQS